MKSSDQHPTAALVHLSEEGVEAQPIPGLLACGQAVPCDLLDGGEIVILAVKPSMWRLVLVSVRWLAAAAAIVVLTPRFVRLYPGFPAGAITQLALLITAVRLILALLQWSSRLYVLTNRRVMCCRGVTQVSLFEAPLVHIRNTYVNVRMVERLCKVGSIGFSLKGVKKVDICWEQISDPHEIHERIRRAIEKALDNHVPY